jgi:hypothetical protein
LSGYKILGSYSKKRKLTADDRWCKDESSGTGKNQFRRADGRRIGWEGSESARWIAVKPSDNAQRPLSIDSQAGRSHLPPSKPLLVYLQTGEALGDSIIHVAAGPVYCLLGKRDLGTTEIPLDKPLITGDLGFHYLTAPTPSWPRIRKSFSILLIDT